MFSNATRAAIKGYLEGFIQGLVERHRGNVGTPSGGRPRVVSKERGELKPFHEAILPQAVRRINAFERSFSTRLGSTFEACAYLIADEVHQNARRGFSISRVEIAEDSASRIEDLLAQNNRGGLPLLFPDQVREVTGGRSDRTVARPAIADLYFVSADSVEWFFEIKSPKPNKGQCLEVTQRLLTIYAMQAKESRPTRAFYAMAYNPYGHRENYEWPYAKRHLDMENQVLLQEEFWTVVGNDPETYRALLEVYEEVGRDKGKDMLDQLAFGL